MSNVENPKIRGICSVFCKSSFTQDTFPGVGYVNLTVDCSAASSHPPFGPTLTSAAPTPLPGISGSLYRSGDAHRMLVLMLRFAESAHLFFCIPQIVLFHMAVM